MRIAVLGYGTVGSGVCNMIKQTSGFELASVLVRRKIDGLDCAVHLIDQIVSDKAIDVVVECIGGVEKPYEFARACISSGKSFVTSNKALVAEKGIELKELALKNNVGFLFSASCGGAIPILHNIEIAKHTDKILSCGGIINGTTNFILSGLQSGKFSSYSEALNEAQRLGYAEADPSADVSGLDTLRKTILISAVSFDKLPAENTLNEGIENIDLCPSNWLSKYCVKLIGRTGLNRDGSVYCYVEPALLEKNSLMGTISENFNCIYYNSENAGKITLVGQGAGREPTSSAVLRDLTTLQNNPKASMLSPNCKSVQADNSKEFHRYLVSDGQKKWIKEESVLSIHKEVGEIRNKGKNIFFAEFDGE